MSNNSTQKLLIGCMAAVLAMGICGCNATKVSYLDPDNAPKPGDKGWVALFNGKDLSGWIARDKSVPISWKAVDGMMCNVSSHDHRGTDIYTEQKFNNFELYYEYRIPKGSNSGMYLRGRYEIQIFDDDSNAKLRPNQKNAAIYDVLAPAEKVDAKAGEWHSVYAKLVGTNLTAVLNGKNIYDNVKLPHATRGGLDQKVGQPGPIYIQGNHGTIDLRNIMIRPLD